MPDATKILERLALYHNRREEVLADPSVRYWVKDNLVALDQRDVVDALDDAELLADLMRLRAAAMLGRST